MSNWDDQTRTSCKICLEFQILGRGATLLKCVFPDTAFLGGLQWLPSKPETHTLSHSYYYTRKYISGTIKNVYLKRISHPVVMQKLLVDSRLHSLLKSFRMTLELMNRQSFSFPKHFQVGKHDLSFARKNRSCLYHSLGFQFTVQYTQRILTAFSSSCILETQLKSFLLKLNENYRETKILSIFFITTHYQITFWKALKAVMHRPGSLICLVS